MNEYMVSYAPGIYQRFEAESLADCARLVKEKTNEKTFMVIPLKDWDEVSRTTPGLMKREWKRKEG